MGRIIIPQIKRMTRVSEAIGTRLTVTHLQQFLPAILNWISDQFLIIKGVGGTFSKLLSFLASQLCSLPSHSTAKVSHTLEVEGVTKKVPKDECQRL